MDRVERRAPAVTEYEIARNIPAHIITFTEQPAALAAFALAGALGPLVMGTGFDRTGSYRDPLILFFVAAAIAAALMTRLGPYRFGAQQAVPNQPILQASVAE